MPADTVVRGLDRETLDREYDNRRKVPDAAEALERWHRLGADARRSMSVRLDVSYGPDERHRYDVFPAATPGAPVLAFIHGGYWRSQDRTIGHFLAPFYVAAGVTFVAVGYRLCPGVTLAELVGDVRRAIDRINVREQEPGSRGLFVAGHSAGGHLAALMCGPGGPGRAVVRGGCSVSGLHDLEPIRLGGLNDSLGFTVADCVELGPLALVRDRAHADSDLPPLIVAVGSEEGREYHYQRDALVDALRAASQPVSVVEAPGANHFTACEALADPAHALSDAMLRLILSPAF